ncbi:MAG: HAD hydrolase family protein [Armatimonadetes bacterium]|nr:HAD hydrolase family protein [Armatimonadota bacterium]
MNDKLSKIKLLAMDVDGTLTDGNIIFLRGEQAKLYSVYDGLGIRLAMNFGLGIAWVTGNVTESVVARAKSLGINDVYQGARFKSEAMKQIAIDHNLTMEEIAFIGDDLNDIPAFECVGVSFAVANAVQEVLDRADIITKKNGGRGAVREAIETILKARGNWDEAVQSFLDELAREEAGESGPEAVA